MWAITHFSCEYFTWINNARNVDDIGRFVLVAFTKIIFVEIEVLGAFRCDRSSSIDASLIGIVYGCALTAVKYAKVKGTVFD